MLTIVALKLAKLAFIYKTNYMTFATMTSPKGGMELKSLSRYPFSREANTVVEPKDDLVMVGDFYALIIGYAYRDMKAGDPLFIKPSDAEKLCKLFRRHFGS